MGVANIGTAAAGSFVVSEGHEQQTVAGLQAGETVTLFFHDYSFPVEVMLDSAYNVTESDESNNHVIEWVPIPTEPLPCATTTPTATQSPASVP
jgi:hypothetical protein